MQSIRKKEVFPRLYTGARNVENSHTQMKILIDTHTHSIASGHAYSTIDDLARGARKRGLAAFALTEHGPTMPASPHAYFFGNLRVIPQKIHGVRFIKGIEANILDTEGTIDLDSKLLLRLDFVMAGLHEICFPPRDRDENTLALVSALRSPLIDTISHSGNPTYPVDARAVVRAAAENGKAIEINNSSFKIRQGSHKNCLLIAELCVEMGVKILCGSDAHYWRDVGNFEAVKALLKEAKVPKELVLSASVKDFDAFIAARKEARKAAIDGK